MAERGDRRTSRSGGYRQLLDDDGPAEHDGWWRSWWRSGSVAGVWWLEAGSVAGGCCSAPAPATARRTPTRRTIAQSSGVVRTAGLPAAAWCGQHDAEVWISGFRSGGGGRPAVQASKQRRGR
ncbi:hypothetical protein Scep_007262 [Stephania cephalantha]|uniref:Uncharacterized protein n=1 Tax=Stephania cephalantha TaxID=152367 RepID=A0AAP0KAS9_9MAGN